MPFYNPPIKGQAFVFTIGLSSQASPGTFKSNPTLATGDFKVGSATGALANLTNIPTCTGSNKIVKVTLTSGEMNFDSLKFIASDQTSPPEWGDLMISILTTSG